MNNNEILFENLDYGTYIIDSEDSSFSENVKYGGAEFNKLHVQRVRLPEGKGNIIYLLTDSFPNNIKTL